MRSTNGTIHKNRRKKLLKATKGFQAGRRRLYRTAKDALMKSLHTAYEDRRVKKRDFRKLWIARINAACRQEGISYSQFIHALKKSNIDLNRKQLSELAIHQPVAFKEVIDIAKKAIS